MLLSAIIRKFAHMKKAVYFLCVFVLGCMAFSACRPSSSSTESAVTTDSVEFDSAAIRIGYLPTLDALPLLVAEQEGLFDSLKTDIQLVEYTSNMDIDTAFVNHRIHGALTDVCRAILHNSNDQEIKIAGKTDGVSYLISQQKLRLRKIADLPERMIAIARNEASDWKLDLMLKEAGMDLSEVNRPQVNNVQLRQEMVSKEMIDAAIVPEPYATAAIVNGDRIIETGSEPLQTGCIIFPQKILVSRETELRFLAMAYNIAVERINNAPQGKYAPLMQKAFGISEQVTDTLQLPEYTILSRPDEKLLEDATEWLKNRYDEQDWLGFRILKKDYKPNRIIDIRLILEK